MTNQISKPFMKFLTSDKENKMIASVVMDFKTTNLICYRNLIFGGFKISHLLS